ncbi:MAG: hypothetical protein RR921_07425 [Mucinivorans sp.]
MIDFQSIKKLLLALLVSRGYTKRPDKSSAGHLVMQNGQGEVRILKANAHGQFDYYYNPGDDSDFGDTVQFLLRELFGHTSGPNAPRLSRQQYLRLEQAIRAIDPAAAITAHVEQSSTVFDIAQHDLQILHNIASLPTPDLYLLQGRGLDPRTLLEPRFAQALRLSKTTIGQREYRNLVFVWRDEEGHIVGGQYKYLRDGVCRKYFLPGSARGTSLWYSDLSNAGKLLVCEDPFDALAHRLLFGTRDYAYAATGGTITASQVALVYSLADRCGLDLVLGNDNDTAGVVSNFRLLDRWGSVLLSHDRSRGTFSLSERDSGAIVFAGSYSSFSHYVFELASSLGLSIEQPTTKDWNAQLLA